MPASHHPVPLDAGVARLVEQLDDNRREAFEERAGILQFDARLPRLDAERQALIQTLARHGFPGQVCLVVLQAEFEGALQWGLVRDEPEGRARLLRLGASTVVRVNVRDVLEAQFGGLAWLSTGGSAPPSLTCRSGMDRGVAGRGTPVSGAVDHASLREL